MSDYSQVVLGDGALFFAPLTASAIDKVTGETAAGTATITADGASFNGSTDYLFWDDVQTTLDEAIEAAQEITVECWIKAPFQDAAGKRVLRWGWYGFYVQVYQFPSQLDGYITVGFTDSTGTNRQVEHYAGWFNNRWHHVVFTYTPGSPLRLWIDGTVRASATYTQALFTDANAGDGLGIGRDGPFDQAHWAGNVRDVSIYDRVLADAEIREHWNAPPTGYTTLFGDGDEWRILKGAPTPSSGGFLDGPTGWLTLGFDDSAWTQIQNGAGSGTPDNTTELLGRIVVSQPVAKGVRWRSAIDANYDYYARRKFTLTQDQLDVGDVIINFGANQLADLYVNGVLFSGINSLDGTAQGSEMSGINEHLVAGENILAIKFADRQGSWDDGLPLDAFFWARVDAPKRTARPTVGFIGFGPWTV